jgi:hypothetical protein
MLSKKFFLDHCYHVLICWNRLHPLYCSSYSMMKTLNNSQWLYFTKRKHLTPKSFKKEPTELLFLGLKTNFATIIISWHFYFIYYYLSFSMDLKDSTKSNSNSSCNSYNPRLISNRTMASIGEFKEIMSSHTPTLITSPSPNSSQSNFYNHSVLYISSLP